MSSFIGMKFNWILPFYLFYFLHLGFGQHLEAGSCSQKCQKALNIDITTDSPVEENADSSYQTHCSCTPGCNIYKDCCFDSTFRTREHNTSEDDMICLFLSNKRGYKAVVKCSNNWNESSIFCTEGIGHLPPVTSHVTGITYANIHCAICNYDAENFVTWKVELKCCPQHDDLKDQSERSIIYRNGYLSSVISRRTHNTRRRCFCKYIVEEQDSSFLDSLELRTCGFESEISKCSATWTNDSMRNMCESFLEPVYIDDKVYRNLYCAQCNNEILDKLYCKPVIAKGMILEGVNQTDIYNYCAQNNLNECLIYFSITGRGKWYAFNKLMNTRRNDCVPEKGKVCCKGERYDYLSKTCRKLE